MPTQILNGFDSKDKDAENWPKGIDWTTWLARIDASELISDSSWAVTGPDSDLTTASDSIVTGSKKTQVRLTGGTPGAVYTVTNTITTSSGVVEDGSLQILIEEH